ncbi:MAG: phosphotransferase [Paraburkholderia sp.]|nr:phosphotransferase [Paraburkholderia sp.]
MNVQEACALAAEAFGVEGRTSPLNSERDQNFRVDANDGTSYVLKISHPAEDPNVTDFQTQVQLCLMKAPGGLPVPHLLPDRAGNYVHWHRAPGAGRRQAVRLNTFLPGVPLHTVERTRAQRRALGSTLGHFDRALAGFTHSEANHPLLWDMQRLAQLRPLMRHIDDEARRRLAGRALDRFELRTAPRVAGLRRQVIHNDLNAHNVLVDAANPDNVAGILDFGDMVEAPLVNDVAVAAAYQLADAPNPLAPALELVAAYHAVNPLTEAEQRVLPDLIVARLLVTVLITGWRAKQHPGNSAYILRNNALSWQGLERFGALTEGETQDMVFNALKPSNGSAYE